jgi:GNAT superfamily N-acetyltransferase
MKTVRCRVLYLQMLNRREHHAPPPIDGIEIVRAEKPTVAFYRFLSDSVGRNWNWVDRKLMPEEDLRGIIGDDRVEIYVLYVAGTPGGYAELDRREENQIEIAYFGIIPEFTGQGLGRYFLHWTVEKAWSYDPRRLWLHTCELDHPAALPMYLKAGFEVFDERVVDQVVL